MIDSEIAKVEDLLQVVKHKRFMTERALKFMCMLSRQAMASAYTSLNSGFLDLEYPNFDPKHGFLNKAAIFIFGILRPFFDFPRWLPIQI